MQPPNTSTTPPSTTRPLRNHNPGHLALTTMAPTFPLSTLSESRQPPSLHSQRGSYDDSSFSYPPSGNTGLLSQVRDLNHQMAVTDHYLRDDPVPETVFSHGSSCPTSSSLLSTRWTKKDTPLPSTTLTRPTLSHPVFMTRTSPPMTKTMRTDPMATPGLPRKINSTQHLDQYRSQVAL
jgi:hypothetical protein